MAQKGLVRGIKAIDCGLDPQWGEPRNMAGKAARLFRDADSLNYGHPSQHLFKDAADRSTQTHTPDETIAMMDKFGVERAIIGVHEENADETLKIMEPDFETVAECNAAAPGILMRLTDLDYPEIHVDCDARPKLAARM